MDTNPLKTPEAPITPDTAAATPELTPELGALPSPEQPSTPESVLEQLSESQEPGAPVASSTAPDATAVNTPAPPSDGPDLSPAAIEKILEKNLAEVYQAIPEYLRPEFREKGAETASKISTLLQSAKLKIREIIDLILNWLKIVPGLNRFFIEKEAAIKAEEILGLFNQKGGDSA